MRVLITGGNGVLAGVLSQELVSKSHTVTLLDNKLMSTPYNSVVVDIRNGNDLLKAMKDHDVIVHTAALHGIHKGFYSDKEFLEVNVLGMYQVLQSAYKLGIKKIIFTSSTSVYGVSRKNTREKAVYIDENSNRQPIDINDLTKVKGEMLCNYFNQEYGMNCISLRIGRFFKGDNIFDYHLTKLYGGIDVLDVVQGIRLAVEAKNLNDNVFCLSSKIRFTKDDLPALMGQADEVIEKYYPGATELFKSNGVILPKIVHRIVDIKRAEAQLGFKPANNFEEFLSELRSKKIVTIS